MKRYCLLAVRVTLVTLIVLIFATLPIQAHPLRATAPRSQTTDPPPPATGPATPEPQRQPIVPSGPPGVLDPALLHAFGDGSQDRLPVLVYMREQVDPYQFARPTLTPLARRRALVGALQSTAARSQSALLTDLYAAQARGAVHDVRPLWIVNAVALRADRETLASLASRPDVRWVAADRWQQWIETAPDTAQPSTPQDGGVEWNVSQVRADEVWNSLHITGTGVVVASVDTGVDWLHPVLRAAYRAYVPSGIADHRYSWYDATGAGASYPVDGNGHGSHTIGSAVGAHGIGVAPGARWIAVRAFDSRGYGYDSWIHAALQWVLAPGGRPDMAPDVVNNSWGNYFSASTEFQADVEALYAAGIFAVFAAGNNGPDPGSVTSPASLPGVFSVGAVDDDDQAANFSGRGPSPWQEIRPHVVAPGVNVRSALPGAAYDSLNGTSMATPHVAGVAALMRSADPAIDVARMAYVLTSTARPVSSVIPNHTTGWGQVDAFRALLAVSHPGFVSGQVTRAGSGAPVSQATLTASTFPDSRPASTAVTDENGTYWLALAAGRYDISVLAFGYTGEQRWGIDVITATTSTQSFQLTALPTGVLSGHVRDGQTGAAPQTPVTLTLAGTPVRSGVSAATGYYSVSVPAGDYTAELRGLGYRVVTATTHVDPGLVTTVDWVLTTTPRILLVDSGAWYYASQAGYYRQALDDLHYAYDLQRIKVLATDPPSAEDLLHYDVVIWSAPYDGPGYVGANGAITTFLSSGGGLFLSGQDVGFVDGSGIVLYAPYYTDYLKARFESDAADSRTLYGQADQIYAGLALTITGAGGADNQSSPDVVATADPDSAAPLFSYQGDGGGYGGIAASLCLDYRAIYLSFGFEAINSAEARRSVMQRAMDWFVSPRRTAGFSVRAPDPLRIGLPGTTVTHTFSLRHTGEAGAPDQFQLALSGAQWDSQIGTATVPLTPCATASGVLSVTVPPSASWNDVDVVTLTVRSANAPGSTGLLTFTTKTPAPVLLVQDARFFDVADRYQRALDRHAVPYDNWSVDRSGSPSLQLLQRYPIVLWYTGYDWYAPVTSAEEQVLQAYLDGGGRLLLSSEHFLGHHDVDAFARYYLGVQAFDEAPKARPMRGVPGHLLSGELGPYTPSYPPGYQIWPDQITPAPGAGAAWRNDRDQAVGLARDRGSWKTIFLSFALEALPEAGRADVLANTVGWLSWLGNSTLTPDRRSVRPGDWLTYTLVLHNDGPLAIRATLSNTLPSALALDPLTLRGPAAFDPLEQRLTWAGWLAPGERITCTYQAAAAEGLTTGAVIDNLVQFGLPELGLSFRRLSRVRVNTPDLSTVVYTHAPDPLRPGQPVSYVAAVRNAGVVDALSATLHAPLPGALPLVTGSLSSGGIGMAAVVETSTLAWVGSIGAGQTMTLTYQVSTEPDPEQPPYYGPLFVSDGSGGTWEQETWLTLQPFRARLPVVLRTCRYWARRVYLPLIIRNEGS